MDIKQVLDFIVQKLKGPGTPLAAAGFMRND